MNFMNINQHYGSIDMPSQIADSFQNQVECSEVEDIQHQSHNHHSNIKKSRYVSDYHMHSDESRDELENNFQSSFQDTFLANLPIILKQNDSRKNLQIEQPQIAINKTKIIRNVLPSQEITQYIQVINSSSNPVILTINCPTQIQIMSQEAYLKNSDLYLPKTNVRQMFLEPWQKNQLGFKIKKNCEELGDIFETISLQSRFQSAYQSKNKNQNKKKRYYIEVQIHYITPKIKMSYQGSSDVTTISLNKVSMNKLAKNKFGQYGIMLTVSGVQRFQCSLEERGDIKLFPKQIILYKDELKKITFKNSGQLGRGAVILRSQNAKVQFVFGVQLI